MIAAKLQLVFHPHHGMKHHCEDVCKLDVWVYLFIYLFFGAGGGGGCGRGGSGHKGYLYKKRVESTSSFFVFFTSLQQHNDNVNEELVKSWRR